jgi:hypothetical protein
VPDCVTPTPCALVWLGPVVTLLILRLMSEDVLKLKFWAPETSPVQVTVVPFCAQPAAAGEAPTTTMAANANPIAASMARTADDTGGLIRKARGSKPKSPRRCSPSLQSARPLGLVRNVVFPHPKKAAPVTP